MEASKPFQLVAVDRLQICLLHGPVPRTEVSKQVNKSNNKMSVSIAQASDITDRLRAAISDSQ